MIGDVDRAVVNAGRDVQAALGQFDLLPLQVADLRGPQTVAIGEQDHGRVAIEQSKHHERKLGMRAALPPRTT